MRICLYLILFIGLVSCGENTATSELYIDKPSKSFKFDLRRNLSSYQNGAYQILSGVNILVGLNLKKEEINFYDLKKEEKLKSIYYGEEEKNIYDVNNFFVINEDSILLNSPHSNTFFLIDGEGAIIDKFQLELNVPDNHQYQYFTLSSTAIFNEFNLSFYYDKRDNDVVIPFLYNNIHLLDEEIAYRYPPSAVVDLSEKQQEIRFLGEFPSSFHEEYVPYQINHNIHVSDAEKVITFPYSDKVYLESSKDFVSIKSKFDKNNYTLLKKGIDPTTEQQINALNGDFMYLYTIVHPDDNSKLIRLCKHQQEIYETEGGKLNGFFDAQWSLIIYDLNAQTVLTEYLLPKKVYDFKHFIPYKQGILLVKSDDYKLLEDEEYLLLDYFKLF